MLSKSQHEMRIPLGDSIHARLPPRALPLDITETAKNEKK